MRAITEPRMPTSLPSTVDRSDFRFVAIDAAGAAWRWIDDKMIWVPGTGSIGDSDQGGWRMRRAPLTAIALVLALAPAVAETYRSINARLTTARTTAIRSRWRRGSSPRSARFTVPIRAPVSEVARETDIEHMVATSKAHDSGLCAAPPSVRTEWTPALNACWFVHAGGGHPSKATDPAVVRGSSLRHGPQPRWRLGAGTQSAGPVRGSSPRTRAKVAAGSLSASSSWSTRIDAYRIPARSSWRALCLMIETSSPDGTVGRYAPNIHS